MKGEIESVRFCVEQACWVFLLFPSYVLVFVRFARFSNVIVAFLFSFLSLQAEAPREQIYLRFPLLRFGLFGSDSNFSPWSSPFLARCFLSLLFSRFSRLFYRSLRDAPCPLSTFGMASEEKSRVPVFRRDFSDFRSVTWRPTHVIHATVTRFYNSYGNLTLLPTSSNFASFRLSSLGRK